jgi:hypothetical protein
MCYLNNIKRSQLPYHWGIQTASEEVSFTEWNGQRSRNVKAYRFDDTK